jgi:hypothetical protein
MRLRGHAVLVAIVATVVGAPAGAAPHAHRAAPPPPSCPLAGRAEVAVPDGIDEVRAIVDTPTPGAAASVMVVDGRSDRELTVWVPADAAGTQSLMTRGGAGAWGLALGSPLPAGRVVVALEPVLDAPASACVDHVELLRRGAVIARVVPR